MEVEVTNCETPLYVAIHLDYGLKPSTGYSVGNNNSAVNTTTTIPNMASYTFGSSVTEDYTVQSENVFKRDPGIGGLVLDGSFTPVANVKVMIYDSNKLQATVYTDQDGWFMWSYKYTGKTATF